MLGQGTKKNGTIDDVYEQVVQDYEKALGAKTRRGLIASRERAHHLAPAVYLPGSGASGDQRQTLRNMAAAVEKIDPESLK